MRFTLGCSGSGICNGTTSIRRQPHVQQCHADSFPGLDSSQTNHPLQVCSCGLPLHTCTCCWRKHNAMSCSTCHGRICNGTHSEATENAKDKPQEPPPTSTRNKGTKSILCSPSWQAVRHVRHTLNLKAKAGDPARTAWHFHLES